jgi:sodium/bile acid cotransporter 7
MRRGWFAGAVLLAAAAGAAWPATGALAGPLSGPATFLALLLTSATLPAARLRAAAGAPAPLLACLVVSQGILPLAGLGLGIAIFGAGSPEAAGLVVAAAVPCTLATATIFTRMAGGDDGLALVYTTISNLASVAILPATLVLLLGRGGFPDPAGAVGSLLLLVPLPVAVGQALRLAAAARLDAARGASTAAAQGLILVVVLASTGRVAAEAGAGSAGAFATLAAATLLLHGIGLAAAAAAGRLLRLTRDRRVAVLFAGSQKTLLLGVAVASAHLPPAALPAALAAILVHHVVQLVVDGAIAGRLAPR